MLLALVAPTTAFAQSKSAPVSEQTLTAIDAYLATQMQELRIPGLALGIVQGDQPVHLKGFGVADPAGRPVTPQTPFILNSISKSFADFGYSVLGSGGLTLGWSILWAGLIFFAGSTSISNPNNKSII